MEIDDREEGRLSTVEVPVGDTGKRARVWSVEANLSSGVSRTRAKLSRKNELKTEGNTLRNQRPSTVSICWLGYDH